MSPSTPLGPIGYSSCREEEGQAMMRTSARRPLERADERALREQNEGILVAVPRLHERSENNHAECNGSDVRPEERALQHVTNQPDVDRRYRRADLRCNDASRANADQKKTENIPRQEWLTKPKDRGERVENNREAAQRRDERGRGETQCCQIEQLGC
eukprot:CAMPEP_0119342364 /NCGR_PEP_ID=MMETSP1333-20130426/104558_1 /TAXON_ID=418940 /ORGANISM="Scyphosphaera apsteinii, Strain RCC1455" /LENGTH=157 /DNA_ID=CAMNT_0007354569 /DNA_START=570 /DNA_END=1044 /DNA_ORIENTATION=+